MITKSRTVTIPGGSGYTLLNGWLRTPISEGYFSPISYSETMTSEPGSRFMGDDDGRSRWKRCDHTGYKVESGTYTGTFSWPSDPRRVSVLTNASLFNANGVAFNSYPRPSDAELPNDGSVINQFWSEARGQISSKDLLPLTDLYSLKALAPSIVRTARAGKSMWNQFMQSRNNEWLRRYGKKHSKKWEKNKFSHKTTSWRDVVTDEIGKDLALKFGLNPLARSLTEFQGMLDPLAAHYAKLKARNNAGVLPYKVSVTSSYSKTPYTGKGYLGGSRVEFNYTVTKGATKTLHVQAECTYNTDDAIGLRAICDAMGLTSLFSTAWDIMPYSFVLDYWTRIGSFAKQLDQYFLHAVPLEKISNMTDAWMIAQCYSTIELTSWRPLPANGVTPEWRPITGKSTHSHFQRYPLGDLPSFFQIPLSWGSGLNIQRSLTGAQLLMQRAL